MWKHSFFIKIKGNAESFSKLEYPNHCNDFDSLTNHESYFGEFEGMERSIGKKTKIKLSLTLLSGNQLIPKHKIIAMIFLWII